MEHAPSVLTRIAENLKLNPAGLSTNALGGILGLDEDQLKPHLDALAKDKKIKSAKGARGRVLHSLV